VVAPLPDTPAERAGIQTGDQITAIDGKTTEGWNSDQAVNTLRGPAGSAVVLTVRRAGVSAPIEFELTRAQIHNRSVASPTLFSGHIGYIALTTVSQASASELRQGIDSLRAAGASSLILDLRGNPGGLLDEGVDVTDLFLNPGQEVVSTRGRAPGSSEQYSDTKPQAWPGMPIVVLVDVYSASAAEIIAGALQDHDRALVVGTPTFGKGLVQSLYILSPETALKLTTARWYTPSGRTIQRASKSEEDQLAAVTAAAAGKDSAAADSAPVFHTDAGRTVRGGGGIRPDIFAAADTFTTVERAFMRALGSNVSVFRDVLTGYALELKSQRAVTSADFTVTPAMVNEALRRLRTRAATVPDSVTAGARSLIAEELGYEAVRYVFGRPAEVRRRMRSDHQVQEALGLARRARLPQDLFAFTAPGSLTNP
jgi:carboxyl-terminal processing protease